MAIPVNCNIKEVKQCVQETIKTTCTNMMDDHSMVRRSGIFLTETEFAERNSKKAEGIQDEKIRKIYNKIFVLTLTHIKNEYPNSLSPLLERIAKDFEPTGVEHFIAFFLYVHFDKMVNNLFTNNPGAYNSSTLWNLKSKKL